MQTKSDRNRLSPQTANRRSYWPVAALSVAMALALAPIAPGQSTPDNPYRPQADSATQPENDGQGSPSSLSLLSPLKPQIKEAPYHPITARQRLRWFLTNTIGPSHLAGGLVTSAFGTALDRPKEYGTHWGGFADRYGMRITGIVTGNATEAALGHLWGEDPRYFRVPDKPAGARVQNIVRLTFVARHRDGTFEPAYARYAAISSNNFLSNTWRVESEANTHDAVLRIGEGFAGRMAANAFEEFWPDLKKLISHRHSKTD